MTHHPERLDPSPEGKVCPHGDFRRILLIRLRFIGDVVLTTPLIRTLRQTFPDAELVYLTEPGPAAILTGQPGIDEVIVLDRRRIGQLPPWQRIREHLRFFAMLRRRRFDLVLDLFGNPRSALLTWATGAPCRVGFDVRGRRAAYNLIIHRTGSICAVDAYLDAARTLGIAVEEDRTHLHVPDALDQWALDWLKARDLAHHWPLIGLCPGASWPAKHWPAARFAELGDRLAERLDARIALIYGPGQESLASEVRHAMTSSPAVVELTPLPELAALIHRLHAFVANDAGPMHIAAGLGVPTVGLFGPSRPDIWFPYPETDGHTALTPGIADCCGKDFCTRAQPCIAGIPVERVFEAVARALRVTGRPA